MAGMAIMATVQFSDGGRLIATIAQQLKQRDILASVTPLRSGPCWATFQATKQSELATITVKHFDGESFPVVHGGLDIDKAPLATIVVVVDDLIDDAPDEVMAAVADALGTRALDQTYTYP